jgi:2,5-diketo-D-gluconate reductase B
MIMASTTILIDGNAMPRLGLGTLHAKGNDCITLVTAALEEGYRLIDTGQYYGNEEQVGRALELTPVPRDDIWVTTKVLHPKAPVAPDLRTAALDSLGRLGLDHVDALLIHWPNPAYDLKQSLEQLAQLREEGRTRVIGVSNFPSALLDEAASNVDVLAIDQVEYHPYLQQRAVLQAVRTHGMVLTAHSPLALGRAVTDPILSDIGETYGVSAAQVSLAWLLAQDSVTAIPGCTADHTDHLRDNLASLELDLTSEDVARIDALADGTRLIDPPHGPVWDEG